LGFRHPIFAILLAIGILTKTLTAGEDAAIRA